MHDGHLVNTSGRLPHALHDDADVVADGELVIELIAAARLLHFRVESHQSATGNKSLSATSTCIVPWQEFL